MLGPAELRELAEALGALRVEMGRDEVRRHPYLTPQFALVKAMTSAVIGKGKPQPPREEESEG